MTPHTTISLLLPPHYHTHTRTPLNSGLYEFGEYATLASYRGSFGMTFANLADPGNGMVAAWAILFAEWFAFMALAWYLEQVFASGTGNRRHPLFFLDGLRRGRKAAANARLSAQAAEMSAALETAEDVAAGEREEREERDEGEGEGERRRRGIDCRLSAPLFG